MAGNDIGWFPLALSVLASAISAVSLLGFPSEVYTHGGQFIVILFSYPFPVLTSMYVFLPIFRQLKVTSVNEVK